MRITKSNLIFFETKLLDFAKKSGRTELPWRKKGMTAYEVWVSEIMLQQTQVSRVIGYYEKFLKKFPTVQKLVKASWEEFLPYYEGLGYYNRGRNMLKTAQVVTEEYGGNFPREAETLRKLPGIGDYTANAILSFAYRMPVLAWDTNLKRVIGRVFFGSKHANIDKVFFEKTLKHKHTLNAALMDFGSALCVAKPKCEACMLKTRCEYYRSKGKQELVKKQTHRTFPIREARAEVFLHEGHRQYFSSVKSRYQPFLLPKGETSRAQIKDWFQKTYGLTVSVRPPHKKFIRKSRPILWVNVQILHGQPSFKTFSKTALTEYTRVSK